MKSAVEFLRALKRNRLVILLPDEPEELKDLAARVDTAGCVAEIRTTAYFEILDRNLLCVRLPWHFVTRTNDWSVLRLFWLDSGRAYGLKLTPEEVDELAEVFRVEELLCRQGKPVKAVGYGCFELRDLLPGERFLVESGDEHQVCRDQRAEAQVQVWQDAESINARRILMYPDTRVFAVSEEQQKRIDRRLKRRKRKL